MADRLLTYMGCRLQQHWTPLLESSSRYWPHLGTDRPFHPRRPVRRPFPFLLQSTLTSQNMASLLTPLTTPMTLHRSTKSYRPTSIAGSSVYGAGQPILGPNQKGLQSDSSLYGGKPMSAAQREVSELVTVPVLGAE
jgi:hypothetical protein